MLLDIIVVIVCGGSATLSCITINNCIKDVCNGYKTANEGAVIIILGLISMALVTTGMLMYIYGD